MQRSTLAKEFKFDRQARELSPETIANCQKQISYFVNCLGGGHHISSLKDVRAAHVREFIVRYKEKGHKPTYINDLLKADKCLFAHAYKEKYTPELATKQVQNMREAYVRFIALPMEPALYLPVHGREPLREGTP